MTSWIRIFICFGMALMLTVSVVTGDIALLINPKFRILIILSIIMLLVLGMIQCWYLKKEEVHPIGLWGYLMILTPILVYLFFPPQALDASMINKKGVTLVSSNQAKERQAKQLEKPRQETPYQKVLNEMKKKPIIIFDEKNYAGYLSALELYPKELQGKKIRIKGFVFKDDPELKKDEFILSRFTVSCCTADASVVGVITKYHQAPILKADEWIEVEGTISTTKLFGYDSPLIELETYRKTQKPKDPYIYFSEN